MNDDRLHALLRESLSAAHPSPQINQTIKSRLEAEPVSGKEGFPMKRMNRKKTLILAAALCAAFAVAATAYTTVVSSIVGSSGNREYTRFEQLSKAEKKAGLDIHAVESFDNGYSFKEMSITHSKDQDDSGNAIREYKGIDIWYSKPSSADIFLSAQPTGTGSEDDRAPVDTGKIDGITVSYYSDTFKFVPPDYELTAEDRANEKKDNYFISYGSSEVEVQQMSFAVWVQDGVQYTLCANDNRPFSQMFSMAEQIIAAT